MVLETILALASLPVTIATVEGIRHHRETESETRHVDEQSRLQDFHLDVYCSSSSRKRDQVDKTMVVLQDGKLYLAPKDDKTGKPLPLPGSKSNKVAHPFTGFYLNFQPELRGPPSMFERLNKPPPFRGLVSTTSTAKPPPLNWIFVDARTFALRYGPRGDADGHILGPWDWTDDEQGLMLEGWEGFVAVEDEEIKGRWSVYYDRGDDLLRGRVGKGVRVLRISLERRVLEMEGDEE